MKLDGHTTPTPFSLHTPQTPLSRRTSLPRLLLRSIPVLLLLLLIGLGWQFAQMRRARPLAGVYLMPDGASYLVLKPGFWPALQVSEGYIRSGFCTTDLESSSFSTSLGRDLMVLKQKQILRFPGTMGNETNVKNILVLQLKPSPRASGDWDLVSANVRETGRASSLLDPFSGPTSNPPSTANLRVAVSRGLRAFRSVDILSGDLDPARAPIPSFLHRVADARAADLCAKEAQGEASDQHLKLLREMTREEPLDLCLGLRRMALEIRMGDLEGAEKTWRRWSAAHGASAHPLPRGTALRARHVLDTKKWRRQHGDLADIWERIGSTDSPPATPSLPVVFQYLRDASQTASLYPCVEEMELREPRWLAKVPNFLTIQVLTKTARVQSVFYLLQGDGTRSLQLLAGTYWMGQSFGAGDLLISKLIGMAVRSIAAGGLELLAFEGCRTPEELKEVWDALDRLANLPGQETGATLLNGEYHPLLAQMRCSGMACPNVPEALARQKVSDARFALLRTAIAAQYRRMTTGEFPKSSAEFGPLLPGGPLPDCFATSSTIRFLEKPDGFHLYSIGPDGRDDASKISYDPSNATMSRGDISVRIPREREYPFPAGGARVNTAAELLKIFPNGLPLDPFATRQGRPLSMIASSRADWETCATPGARKLYAGGAPGNDDPKSSSTLSPLPRAEDATTTTVPVTVFSFGPDKDENSYADYQYLTGEDVFTTCSHPSALYQLVFPPSGIPQPASTAPAAQPVPVGPPRQGAPPGIPHSAPLGFSRATARRPLGGAGIGGGYPGPGAGSEYLQAFYDTTNGTRSKGNLYLALPRP